MIIHFHGFASAGKGSKYKMLQDCYPNQNIWSPDLPINPNEVERLLEERLDNRNPTSDKISVISEMATRPEKEPAYDQSQKVAFVGTSMGGFYALYFSIVFGTPAVLINPVTNPSTHMRKYLGIQKNLKTGKPFEWKKAYLNTLEKMEQTIQGATIENNRIFVALGQKDQSVDPEQAKRFFPDQVRIKVYPDDHRFLTWFPKVLVEKEVRALLTYHEIIHTKA